MLYVQIEGLYGEAYEKLDWPAVRLAWAGEPLAEEKPKTCPWWAERCRVTMDEAEALTKAGLKLIVLPPNGMMNVKLRERKPRDGWDHDVRPEDIEAGRVVQIAVPDHALIHIDEVCVEEDFCTDALQSMLNDGWRILAICPPNAQRRPDYILGRRKAADPFTR